MVLMFTLAWLSMLLKPVNNVITVMRYSFFRFMSVLMYKSVTRLLIVIRVISIINLILFIRFIRIVGAFRTINANEVYNWF
jgi:hypothetical protein